MESPKRITNRNSGTRDPIDPVERKSSSPSAQVCWKTRTSSPSAAAADSRFSATPISPRTTERNAYSVIRKVTSSNAPRTSGSLPFWCAG